MGNERPAFHLYTGDLLKDPLFLLCHWQAQNLWIRLLVHLHEMPYRGRFLKPDGITPWTDEEIALLCNVPIADFMALSEILYSNHVASRIGGAMANRRMVRESEVIELKSKSGKIGATVRWRNDGKADGKAMADPDGRAMAGGMADVSSSSSSCHSSPTLSKKKEVVEEEEGSGEEKDAQAPPAPTAAAYSLEEIRTKWNSIPGVKPCKAITGVLTTRINALRKIHGTQWWDDLFLEVTASPFLLGKIAGKEGRASFQADLMWLTGPLNLAKVLSGKYSHKPIRKSSL